MSRWQGSLALQVAADHAETGRPGGRLKLLAADGARVESYAARDGRPDREIEAFLSRVPDRPHDYVADIQLRGWICYCGIFNGEERERLEQCRTCQAQRPM